MVGSAVIASFEGLAVAAGLASMVGSAAAVSIDVVVVDRASAR